MQKCERKIMDRIRRLMNTWLLSESNAEAAAAAAKARRLTRQLGHYVVEDDEPTEVGIQRAAIELDDHLRRHEFRRVPTRPRLAAGTSPNLAVGSSSPLATALPEDYDGFDHGFQCPPSEFDAVPEVEAATEFVEVPTRNLRPPCGRSS